MQIKQKNQKKKFENFFFTCFPQVYIYHFMYTGWVFLMFMMDFTYYLECSIVHNACTLCKDDAPKWYVKGSLCIVVLQDHYCHFVFAGFRRVWQTLLKPGGLSKTLSPIHKSNFCSFAIFSRNVPNIRILQDRYLFCEMGIFRI